MSRLANFGIPTSKQPSDGHVYADRLLRYFVWPNMEDVLAHVVVNSRLLEGLIIALHQDFMAFFKCKHQELILRVARKQLSHINYYFFILNILASGASNLKGFRFRAEPLTEEEPNLHLKNTSLETWQECGGAGSEDKSRLPILVLMQCVDQTGV